MLKELTVGLNGYIAYKTKKKGDPLVYEPWKQLILMRVRDKLATGENALCPSGGMG